MGFLSSLFGGGFDKRLQAATRYEEQGELGLAKAEYQAALAKAKGQPEDLVARAREGLARVRRGLGLQNLERGQRLAEDGFFDEAEDHLHLALELLEAEDDRQQALDALADLERKAIQAPEEEEIQPEGEEFMGTSQEERFEIFLMGLEDQSLVEEYRSLGPDMASAVLALAEGRPADAATLLEGLLDGGEDHPLVHLELGRAILFTEGRDPEEAIGHLEAWVAEHPGDWQAGSSLAEALRRAGRVEEATGLLDRMAGEAHGDSLAVQHLAEHYLVLDEFEKAARTAADGLRDHPNDLGLKRLLGMALYKMGRSDQAVKLLEGVLEQTWRYDPDTEELEIDRETAFVLTRIYMAGESDTGLERANGLLRALEQGAQDERERIQLILDQGEIMLRLGARDDGVRLLGNALALASGHEDLAERARGLLDGA